MNNQNQSQLGGATFNQPSWMIAPQEEPKKDGVSKLFIVIIAIFIIGAVAVICAIILNNKTATEDKPIGDSVIETTEYIVGNVDLVQTFINAATNNGSVTRAQCKEMVSYGNKYASIYNLKKVSDSFCDNATINVGVTYEEGKSYPNEPMTVIVLQASSEYLKFPFYSSLYSMQDYEVLTKCSAKTTAVEVKE